LADQVLKYNIYYTVYRKLHDESSLANKSWKAAEHPRCRTLRSAYDVSAPGFGSTRVWLVNSGYEQWPGLNSIRYTCDARYWVRSIRNFSKLFGIRSFRAFRDFARNDRIYRICLKFYVMLST